MDASLHCRQDFFLKLDIASTQGNFIAKPVTQIKKLWCQQGSFMIGTLHYTLFAILPRSYLTQFMTNHFLTYKALTQDCTRVFPYSKPFEYWFTLYRLTFLQVLRQQLYYMRDFIMTCRDKESLIVHVNRRFHLINDVDFFSIRDFQEAAQEILYNFLLDLSERFILHIKGCLLCKAKGTICEVCSSVRCWSVLVFLFLFQDKPIYPFNLRNTIQCTGCKRFFHRACYVKETCPRCIRKNVK